MSDKITAAPAKTIIKTLCQLGLEYPDHFAIAVARRPLPNGRRRLRSDPPGIPVGIRIDLIEDQVVERLVADNADFIETETARAGHPFMVKVGRVGQYVVPSVAHLLASASRGRTQRDRGACARWGHTIAETGRCTVCGQRQDGTLTEIEEGRR